MVQPNLIIEGRGQGILAKVMDWTTTKSVGSQQRYPIDQRKSNAKLIKASAYSTFYIILENNDPSLGDDFTVSAIIAKKAGTSWTMEYKFDGTVKALPYAFHVNAMGRGVIEVKLTAPSSFIPGEMCYVIITAKSTSASGQYDSMDAVKCIGVGPLLVFTDIEKRAEGLINDEDLNPSYATYTSQQVVETFIDEETELVIKDCLDRMVGIQVDEYDKLRSYLINRVLFREVQRMAQNTMDGGAVFGPTLSLIADEANRLHSQIFYGYGI